ncbi:MAG: ATP-binding protein [Dehalococcoidia bacterium]
MLGQLGLQKRIMLYVTLGLVVMFGGFSLIGMQAVNRGRQLAFEERLAIAESVAASLAGELGHVVRDTAEDMEGLTPGASKAALQGATEKAYRHLAATDEFSFFSVTAVAMFDSAGRFITAAPSDAPFVGARALEVVGTEAVAAGPAARVIWLGEGEWRSPCLSIPLIDARGGTWARMLVHIEGVRSHEPFVPFGMLNLSLSETAVPGELSRRAQYHLEVLSASGRTLLSAGFDKTPGPESPHYPVIRSLMDTGDSDAMLHRLPKGALGQNHVMAVVPVPGSGLYLILEQDVDVALALPNEFRRRLILYGTIGFMVTLLVAWLTTRRVVLSTEQLTAAAVRMARGELSTAIQVDAQDEIGTLAENLEAMRQQLNDALEQVETTNRDLEIRVQERTRQLQELIRRVLTAQEEERHRVALELHDETAQSISALTVTLDYVLARSEGLSDEELERLREARQVAADLLQGIRRLMYALRPIALEDMGLAAALRWYGEDLLERSGVRVSVTAGSTDARVSDHAELALYRIGQEALNNISRHAGAANVWIDIAYPDSAVNLRVRDDGAGFDPASAAGDSSAAGGLGLAGMRERAALAGGSLTIESAPGQGTTVRAEVPFDADA